MTEFLVGLIMCAWFAALLLIGAQTLVTAGVFAFFLFLLKFVAASFAAIILLIITAFLACAIRICLDAIADKLKGARK